MKKYVYIGETNRSAFERGREHHNDIAACKTSSHMLRHLLDVHEEDEENWSEVKFSMKILRSTRTAFKRQILESVLIQKERKGHYIMNSKSEYNRCAIPRLTAKLGEKDLERWREEDKKELEKEATIEEKIRIRKKEKYKERGTIRRRTERGQPAKKKRRIQEDADQGSLAINININDDEDKKRQLPAVTPQKRKVGEGREKDQR